MTGPLLNQRVPVVGGGFGGLAAACYLADAGADVRLVEKNDHLGGVAGRIERDGFQFDTGPSWYLMPDVFERFFDHFDRDPADYYDLQRLDPKYRVLWKDGDRVDVPDDPAAVRGLFESYESGAGEAFDAYLEEAAYTYEVGMERFVYEDRPRLRDFLDTDVLRSARGLSLLGSMDEHVADYFDHPKLRQLMQYTLVFLGGAPHNTPALYNLMAHVDHELGVYYPTGGVHSVVEGLADLARELGVTIETGRPVTALEPATDGLTAQTPTGPVTGDAIVANANPAHVEQDLLTGASDGPLGGWESATYAPSAFMLYLGVEGSVDPLAHHTLVLPEDWDPHFAAIFDEPRWPTDPAYYVNVPSRTDDTVAPDGCHTVVVLVPIAPGLEDDADARARYREQVLTDLATDAGVDLRGRIRVEETACVSEFAEWVNAPQGTALGLAHTLGQTGPLRPSHRGPLEGLYYTGGYTTPGIGMPMCLISGEHTAEAVAKDAQSARPLARLAELG
ncbi:phytoene desaturase family protein [Halosegnis sp.]|uniref:phytoene desaturase family protein n=1 Tax=Halosegnis sp. TaxID=2864959 RepID=UPI0035D49086